ncbi:MAG: hypothetical protein WD823_06235 [Sulfuricaulis sp.]|uniref:hypothetical protein n=1 Tax=Sulfuricaulis sp. TaxID=2003553 RepID=UPI0034A26418
MVKKWLHLTELGGDPWVLPIWAAVHDAIKNGVVKEIPTELSEQGLYISVRLNFLPRIVSRINTEVKELYEIMKTHQPKHEFCEGIEGVSFDIDNNLKYQLLIDIDSLLFELNSVCELKGQFFEQLHTLANKPMPKKNAGLSVKHMLDAAKQDSSWFVTLDNHRNFFSHKGAPYLAVDISSCPGAADVLIMKENIKSFRDESKFLRLSDINNIVQGFAASKLVIQEYLRGLFLQA